MSQKDQLKEQAKEDDEKIRRTNAIFDKCDREQLKDLEKSKKDYLVLIVQLRKVYRTRLAITILIILCMMTEIGMFIMYHQERIEVDNEVNACKYAVNNCPTPPISCPTNFNRALSECGINEKLLRGEKDSYIVCQEANRRLSIHPDRVLT